MLRLGAGLGLFVALSCHSPDTRESLPITWEPMMELNASLPAGVRVCEGINYRLPLSAWYVEVIAGDSLIHPQVVVSGDEDQLTSPSELAKTMQACVMVNGGFYRTDQANPTHIGLLKIQGTLLAAPTPSILFNGNRFPVARSAIGITADGGIDIAWILSHGDTLLEVPSPPNHLPDQPDANFDSSVEGRIWRVRDALAGGPSLITDGQIRVTAYGEGFFGDSIEEPHPRTAVGYTEEGHLIFLVVDGRQESSRGVDLYELALIMQNLGCLEALNLDGGGSSALVVNGELINRPLGRDLDREIMSALAVFSREEHLFELSSRHP